MIREEPDVSRLPSNPRTLIAVAALCCIIPILVRGQSCGHDFDFHLLSWLEAAHQFAQGTFPHWAFTPAFNAGEPRFIFYPPLSWCLGALLGLILPWTLVPVAFIWIALTLSGLTFYAFARRYTSSPTALLGAVLYLANPYMLFTAYERSAFAELLAAAWLPLLLAAALDPRVRIIPLALPLALLWLTNAPAAVMCTYALAFLIIIRLVVNGRNSAEPHSLSISLPSEASTRLHLALVTSAATALGLALAAFYIVPAAYERRFVQIQMLVIEGMRVSDHFLFHRMPGPTPDDRFHDAVVRTASIIAVNLLAAIAAAVLTLIPHRKDSPSARTHAILPLGLLALLIAFLLTPLSLPVWQNLPDLAFLQFPWRLNALLGLIFAFLTTLALPRRLPALLPLPIAALMIVPAWLLFHQPCDPEDSVPARVALFHSNLGTDPTDEYTPLAADPDALHPHDPPYWLIPATSQNPAADAPDNVQIDAAAPPGLAPGPAPHHLTLSLSAPRYLVLNLRDYPAWQLSLNHIVLQPSAPPRRVHREDGLITVLLPAGTDTIDLTLIRTPDESLGILISTLALVTALALRFKLHSTSLAPSPSGISPPKPA